MGERPRGLWAHTDFLKFWAGQSLSLLGSTVSALALPLTAVLVLGATPAQMGILTALGALPAVLLGLFAGVWVDRSRRRRLMIAADLLRAVLLFTIPLAALVGVLRIEHLYLAIPLVASGTLFFNVANSAYFPALVGREHLVDANRKLSLSGSLAEILGPGLAGALVQIVTAPIAIAVDAISYVVSALFLAWMNTPEAVSRPPAARSSLRRELAEGLKLIVDHSLLRAIAGSLCTVNLFNAVFEAVALVYLTRDLALDPGLLGLIFASGSLGFLCGSLLQGVVDRRIGLGPTIVGGLLLVGISDLLIPLLDRSVARWTIVAVLVGAQFCFGLGLTFFNIGQVSVRQSATPDHVLGRVSASLQFLVAAVIPLGGILGGVIGQTLGSRVTLGLAAVGEIMAVIWLFRSPVPLLRGRSALPGQ